MLKTDGIIFDLDGTLWDSVAMGFKAWHIKLQEKGINADFDFDTFKSCYGLPMDQFFAKLGISIDNLDSFMMELLDFENEYLTQWGGILYPELEDTLKKLIGKFPLFIVSNCQKGYVEAFLTAHHMEGYFKDFVSYGDTGYYKADNISYLSKRNGLQYPVYVGDIQGDSDATHAAGLPFIHAAYGFGEVKDAEERIDTFADILKVVESI